MLREKQYNCDERGTKIDETLSEYTVGTKTTIIGSRSFVVACTVKYCISYSHDYYFATFVTVGLISQ